MAEYLSSIQGNINTETTGAQIPLGPDTSVETAADALLAVL